jgi:hypothetical protein
MKDNKEETREEKLKRLLDWEDKNNLMFNLDELAHNYPSRKVAKNMIVYSHKSKSNYTPYSPN